MTLRLSRATLPASFRFTLESAERKFTLTLTQPQISVVQTRIAMKKFKPGGRLHRLTMTRPRLGQQDFSFQNQHAAFKMLVPAWTEEELHAMLMARLRYRPASLLDLSQALIMPTGNAQHRLAHALAFLEQQRRVACVSPGRYFALPWERLGHPYTPPAFSLGGYSSLAAGFWRQQGVVPTTEQEPDENVRDVVERHFEWQRMKAAGLPARARPGAVTYLSEYVTHQPYPGLT